MRVFYFGETSLEEVDSYKYLGSNVDNNGGTGGYINCIIQMAREEFIALGNVRKIKEINTSTELNILNFNAKSVLLNELKI